MPIKREMLDCKSLQGQFNVYFTAKVVGIINRNKQTFNV